MGSGMNVEQAKEYAKTMTYKQAVSNCFHAKGIMYRKATLIKLHELAEIADKLDKANTPQTDCDKCIWNVCNYNKVEWDADTPQTEESCERCVYVRGSQWCQGCNGTPKRWDGEKIVDTPQTDCETCRHYKLACELFSEVCKYEPTTQTETQNSNLTFDTPQTESTGSPIGDYRDGVGAWQTDCGWGEPNE